MSRVYERRLQTAYRESNNDNEVEVKCAHGWGLYGSYKVGVQKVSPGRAASTRLSGPLVYARVSSQGRPRRIWRSSRALVPGWLGCTQSHSDVFLQTYRSTDLRTYNNGYCNDGLLKTMLPLYDPTHPEESCKKQPNVFESQLS